MPQASQTNPSGQSVSIDALLTLPARRVLLLQGASLAAACLTPISMPEALAQTSPPVAGARTADGAAPDLKSAIDRFTAGRALQRGKVQLDVATLIDNGNTVPVRVVVDHPMQTDHHVKAIALFAERNPQHEVGEFWLSPSQGVAEVATRIRLATTQRLIAIAALSDGSFWFDELELLVTLAACIEGD